jgi:CRP/FNR family transcriptional regulator
MQSKGKGMLNTSATFQSGFTAAIGIHMLSTIDHPRKGGRLWSTLADISELLALPLSETPKDDGTVFQHVQFKRGQRVHTIGQSFDMLYIVNSGFLKTVTIDESGNEQVLGFPMKGSLFGIDGIHTRQYASETVALTNCDVILVPFKTLISLGRTCPEFEASVFGIMSRELIHEQTMLSMIASLGAEARVARFLVWLSERFTQMGYSGKSFNLRMTRHEIGSYLGLTLETVSRTLSAFDSLGLISVDKKAIDIIDTNALRTLRRLSPSKSRGRLQIGKAANRMSGPSGCAFTAV